MGELGFQELHKCASGKLKIEAGQLGAKKKKKGGGGGGTCSEFSHIKAADEDTCESQRRRLAEESCGGSAIVTLEAVRVDENSHTITMQGQ